MGWPRRSLLACVASAVVLSSLVGSSVEASTRVQPAGWVAYTRVWHGSNHDHTWLALCDLAGKHCHDITARPAKGAVRNDFAPVWSPDGRRLAFMRYTARSSAPNAVALYVVNRDGTGLRRLLALPRSEAKYGVYGVDHENAEESPYYAWSPDGQRLVYADGPLYVLDRDGGQRRLLARSGACKPSWSPDGARILYLVDGSCGRRGANAPDPGHRAVARIGADGSGQRQLVSGSFGSAAWSPNGSTIAVTDHCRVFHGGDWFCGVSLINPDGSGKRVLVKSEYGGWARWIAGGTAVLWPDYPNMWATDMGTGKEHAIGPARYPEVGLLAGVSADGQHVAVLTSDTYNSPNPTPRLLIVNASGRLAQRIVVPAGWRARAAAVYLP